MIIARNGQRFWHLRRDYLGRLQALQDDMTVNERIEAAIRHYIDDVDPNSRNEEYGRQNLNLGWTDSPEGEPSTIVENIFVPDDLVGELEDIHSDGPEDIAIDIALNTAVRLWLIERGEEGLKP